MRESLPFRSLLTVPLSVKYPFHTFEIRRRLTGRLAFRRRSGGYVPSLSVLATDCAKQWQGAKICLASKVAKLC
ncbi:hypothetical protein MPL3365_30272 [Mesorhizobium plurifarium]|uniref:Uncharacterized protein n=1 Tax=Mesorhizobium plurifarium TaxID=69974 RepID=A0A090GV39_MESPL|nr:hypothetical protein MPL3365_30272 [Mesorhizobium plurifarium]